MQIVFVGWIVFLETIFTHINLKPEAGFLLKKMPDSFVETGHGLTDMIIDCTEFKFQHVSNLDLNSLVFSNYKNTITGKAVIGIAPHGMGLFFSDICLSLVHVLVSQGLSIGFNQNMNQWQTDITEKKTHPMWCNSNESFACYGVLVVRKHERI